MVIVHIHASETFKLGSCLLWEGLICLYTVGEPCVASGFWRDDGVKRSTFAWNIKVALVRMKPHLTVGKNSILMKVGNPQHAHDFIGFPVRHGALCVDFAKNLTKLLVLEIAQFLPG
jgi:hypothetical protein